MSNIIKTVSVIFLFLFTNNITAQENKLNFEIEFTPKICFRTDYDENRGFNTLKEFKKPIALFDIGFNTKYLIKENSKIGIGLFYSVIGNASPLNVTDTYDTNITYNFNSDYTYSYIEFPLFYEYNLKHNFFFKTGLVYRRAVSGIVRYKNLPDSLFGYSKEEFIEIMDKTYSSADLKEMNFNMNNLALLVNAGRNFNISEKLYFALGLQFKANIFPAFKKGNRIDFYYYSSGINLIIGLK